IGFEIVQLHPIANPCNVRWVRFYRKYADLLGQDGGGGEGMDPEMRANVNEHIVRNQMEIEESAQREFPSSPSNVVIKHTRRAQVVAYERRRKSQRETWDSICIEGRGWKLYFGRIRKFL